MDERFEHMPSDDLAAQLGELSLLPDGGTADPSAWESWLAAVDKAKRGSIDVRLILNKSENQKEC